MVDYLVDSMVVQMVVYLVATTGVRLVDNLVDCLAARVSRY